MSLPAIIDFVFKCFNRMFSALVRSLLRNESGWKGLSSLGSCLLAENLQEQQTLYIIYVAVLSNTKGCFTFLSHCQTVFRAPSCLHGLR